MNELTLLRFFWFAYAFVLSFLMPRKQANPVADLVDAHLLEYLLVQLQEVLAIDVVLPEEHFIFAAVDAPQESQTSSSSQFLTESGPSASENSGTCRARVCLRSTGHRGQSS